MDCENCSGRFYSHEDLSCDCLCHIRDMDTIGKEKVREVKQCQLCAAMLAAGEGPCSTHKPIVEAATRFGHDI